MNLYYDDYGPYGNQDDLGNGNQNSPGEPITYVMELILTEMI